MCCSGIDRNISLDEDGTRDGDLFLLDLTKAGRVIVSVFNHQDIYNQDNIIYWLIQHHIFFCVCVCFLSLDGDSAHSNFNNLKIIICGVNKCGNFYFICSYLETNAFPGCFWCALQGVGSFRGRTKTFRHTPGRTIVWPQNAGPPPDVPECGYKGMRCTYSTNLTNLTGKYLLDSFQFVCQISVSAYTSQVLTFLIECGDMLNVRRKAGWHTFSWGWGWGRVGWICHNVTSRF